MVYHRCWLYSQRVADILFLTAVNGNQPGDPELTVNAVIDIVKGEGLAKGKAFPTVVSLGGSGYDIVGGACTGLVGLETWKDLTSSVDFPQGA